MNLRASILIGCFLLGAVAVARADRPEATPIGKSLKLLPMNIADFQGRDDPPFAPNILAVLGVDDYIIRSYYSQERREFAGLYVGYYQSQRQGDTMHSPLNCLPGAGWEPVSKSFLKVTVPADRSGATREIEVNRYVIQKGLDRQLVLYWYQSHGRVVASEYWGKVFLVKDAVQLNRTDGSLVRVIVPVPTSTDETAAEAAGVRFMQSVFPELSSLLPS